MPIQKNGVIAIGGILLLYIGITIAVVAIPSTNLYNLFVRLFALYGYSAISIAAIMTPFLKEITKSFGRPFITIHHIFAVAGLLLITLHPVMYSLQTLNLGVFIPRFDSWNIFWELAGRPALYLLYIAAGAALLRRRGLRYWRGIHALTYLVLFFGIVHANLIGTSFAIGAVDPSTITLDFSNLVTAMLFDTLFVIAILTFFIKRYQIYQQQVQRYNK